jgi:hypothetical protein
LFIRSNGLRDNWLTKYQESDTLQPILPAFVFNWGLFEFMVHRSDNSVSSRFERTSF